MIGIDAYYITYYLENIQIFILLIRNIKYQAKKNANIETNPKSNIPRRYHNFLNVFLKK